MLILVIDRLPLGLRVSESIRAILRVRTDVKAEYYVEPPLTKEEYEEDLAKYSMYVFSFYQYHSR